MKNILGDLREDKAMPKKRGAPKGNKNAQKHGLYAHSYLPGENTELYQTRIEQCQNNIKFFKVLIARTAERRKPSASNPMSFQENVLILHTVVIAISRLYSAINTKHQMIFGKEKDTEKEMIEFCQRLGMTQAEIDEELFGSIPVWSDGKKRGAQYGNLNALKHGFFASHYRLEELRTLEDVDESDVMEEIALLQVLMKRVFIGMTVDIPLFDHLRAVRVLSYADACLEKLHRIRGFMFNTEAGISAALEELRGEMDIG